ncbi:transmembrane protein 126A isoform X2 [Rana temporaria]|nr:transmembrane protein 126A isoform X2 [Rana temporaria]
MEGQSDGDMNQTSAKEPVMPISQFLQQNHKNLPRLEKFFFDYASSFMAANSFACGLLAHNFFRRALKVRRYYLLSSLPATVVPFVFTNIYHELLVTQPLLEGSLNCAPCAMMRGVYIGMCMGGVAPVLLAGYVNLMMVPSVLRTEMKGSALREMISFTKPVFRKLKYFFLFEAIASVAISTGQFATMEKLLEMSPVSQTQEEPRE